jgi:hypothetical protein
MGLFYKVGEFPYGSVCIRFFINQSFRFEVLGFLIIEFSSCWHPTFSNFSVRYAEVSILT